VQGPKEGPCYPWAPAIGSRTGLSTHSPGQSAGKHRAIILKGHRQEQSSPQKNKKKKKNPRSSVVVDTLGHTTCPAALSTLPTAKPTHAMLNLQVTRQEHQQDKTKRVPLSSHPDMPIISYTRLSTSFPPSIQMVAVSPMKLEVNRQEQKTKRKQ
jgi:hypothetical protein